MEFDKKERKRDGRKGRERIDDEGRLGSRRKSKRQVKKTQKENRRNNPR